MAALLLHAHVCGADTFQVQVLNFALLVLTEAGKQRMPMRWNASVLGVHSY